MTGELAAWAAGSYLVGSIPTGYLVGLLHRIDVRASGSGNVGATNVARSVGTAAGIATLVIDAAKGATPVLLVDATDWLAGPEPSLQLRARVVAALAAVCGHVFPVWLRLRGGKGVATTLGALLALAPPIALGSALVFAAVLAISRFVSAASIAGALAAPAGSVALGEPRLVSGAAALLAALILVRHRENLERLCTGTEPPLGSRGEKS